MASPRVLSRADPSTGRKNSGPGPDHYEPDALSIKRQFPAWTIGDPRGRKGRQLSTTPWLGKTLTMEPTVVFSPGRLREAVQFSFSASLFLFIV